MLRTSSAATLTTTRQPGPVVARPIDADAIKAKAIEANTAIDRRAFKLTSRAKPLLQSKAASLGFERADRVPGEGGGQLRGLIRRAGVWGETCKGTALMPDRFDPYQCGLFV